MRSVADDLQELAEGRGFAALSHGDHASDTWILMDFVDVLIHIQSEDARLYYDLDNLWGDSRRVEWRDTLT